MTKSSNPSYTTCEEPSGKDLCTVTHEDGIHRTKEETNDGYGDGVLYERGHNPDCNFQPVSSIESVGKEAQLDNDIQDGKERVDKHYTTFSDLSSVVRRMKLYDSGDPQTLRLSHSRRIRPSIRP